MHEFLLSDPGWQEDPVHLVADARAVMDDLPETAATFKLKDIINHSYIAQAEEEILGFLGAWPMPDIYARSEQKGKQYVNPHYIHSFRYTSCYTECECGNIQTHPQPKDTEVEPPIQNANEHGEGCKPYHRMEVRADLMRQREEIISTSIRRGIERLKIARRIGLQGNHISHVCKRLGIPIEEIRGEFIRERGETMVALAKQGYKTETIADVYSVSRGHVSKQIKEFSDTTMKQIREAEA